MRAISIALRRPQRPLTRWGLRFGLLALLIQLLAVVLPMPVSATTPGMPAWLAASLCRTAPADIPGERPVQPGHIVCPVCFVLSAAAAAVPPQPPAVRAPAPQPSLAPALPRALGLPPQPAGATPLSRAPPAA